mmetsp:Transcript_23826/g.47565  ORF Transcript_23826/g.47565 Transcript_23826/m.47565 type:complete len:231 (-) Transcript_23826:464-1156(-)
MRTQGGKQRGHARAHAHAHAHGHAHCTQGHSCASVLAERMTVGGSGKNGAEAGGSGLRTIFLPPEDKERLCLPTLLPPPPPTLLPPPRPLSDLPPPPPPPPPLLLPPAPLPPRAPSRARLEGRPWPASPSAPRSDLLLTEGSGGCSSSETMSSPTTSCASADNSAVRAAKSAARSGCIEALAFVLRAHSSGSTNTSGGGGGGGGGGSGGGGSPCPVGSVHVASPVAGQAK